MTGPMRWARIWVKALGHALEGKSMPSIRGKVRGNLGFWFLGCGSLGFKNRETHARQQSRARNKGCEQKAF